MRAKQRAHAGRAKGAVAASVMRAAGSLMLAESSPWHRNQAFEPYDRPGEEIAMARIDELTDGIYRIATTVEIPGGDFTFNQFLIDDERPALVHTGMHNLYEGVRNAVLEVLDPAKLAYVILLHFESDECGGMDRFLEGAPAQRLPAAP
jgi:hypothetical protein